MNNTDKLKYAVLGALVIAALICWTGQPLRFLEEKGILACSNCGVQACPTCIFNGVDCVGYCTDEEGLEECSNLGGGQCGCVVPA